MAGKKFEITDNTPSKDRKPLNKDLFKELRKKYKV